MRYIPESRVTDNYPESQDPPLVITELLCMAEKRDILKTTILHNKLPIVEMQSISTSQLAETIKWIDCHIHGDRSMAYCNDVFRLLGVGSIK